MTNLLVIFVFGILQYSESYKLDKHVNPLVIDFLNLENIPTKVNLIQCWNKGLNTHTQTLTVFNSNKNNTHSS